MNGHVRFLKIKMEKPNKTNDILTALAYLSVLALAFLILPSAQNRDVRYIAVGIILFGILYFGSLSFMCFKKVPIPSLVLLIFGIFTAGFGVALFLHHYDIDQLFNIYKQFGKFIDEKF